MTINGRLYCHSAKLIFAAPVFILTCFNIAALGDLMSALPVSASTRKIAVNELPFGARVDFFDVITGLDFYRIFLTTGARNPTHKIAQNTCSHDRCTHKTTPFMLHSTLFLGLCFGSQLNYYETASR
jgi:hypothetical protein